MVNKLLLFFFDTKHSWVCITSGTTVVMSVAAISRGSEQMWNYHISGSLWLSHVFNREINQEIRVDLVASVFMIYHSI